jgi:hypothetical protein
MAAVRSVAMVVLVVLAAGCEQPDPAQIVQPLETTLGAAVPAAYFAAVSMAALGGRPSPCATVVTPAASGGDVRVEVSLGPGCPQMFGANELGTTVVTGAWTPQLATFVMDFTGVSSDGRPLLVEGVASMTVVPTDATHLVVAYGEEDIEVGTSIPAAGVKQVAWVVDVDTAGTDDPSDDSISVSGGSQSLFALGGTTSAGDVTQVAVGDAVFNAGCRRNPNSGIAAVQRASTSGGGWVLFHFHDACDGNADVAAALAPYELLITDSLPLAFLQQ